uniref:C-type lectin domain-containing protein n=1 Tax=Parastrongyloides trichosuri TaxID=131310 RepID=A0A0N4ZJX3_PARTI
MIIFYLILQVFLISVETFYIENSSIFSPYTSCSNDGFILSEGNKCYKAFQHAKSFQEAEGICLKLNSTVASLHSFMDKYNFIRFIEKHKMRNEKAIVMTGYRCFNKQVCSWIDHTRFVFTSGFQTSKNDLPCYGILSNHLSSWSCIDKVEENINIIFVCERMSSSLPECDIKDYERKADGHCYKRLDVNGKYTKRVAQSICRDDGANLPIIHNHLEHFVVNELANGEGIHLGLKCSGGSINSKNCYWSDKSKLDYIGFEDSFNMNSISSSCFTTTNDYYWSTGSCKHLRTVICQIRMNYKNRTPLSDFSINESPNNIIERMRTETMIDFSMEGLDFDSKGSLLLQTNQSIRNANNFLLSIKNEEVTQTIETSTVTEENDEIVEEVIEDNIPEKESVTDVDFNVDK